MPHQKLAELQNANKTTELMMLTEELKTYPFGYIWDYWCETQGVPAGGSWFAEVEKYEQDVLLNRR